MEIILNKLWQYNDWANTSLLSSLEQQGTALPGTSLHLISHIMNAQMIWLNRIRGLPQQYGVWDDHDLHTCRNMHEEASPLLKQEIANHAAELQKIIHYTNTRGISYENKLDDIFLQIFNHGTYHRAQIAQNSRINAQEPINTDYINFARS
jgi:uncharacterized damage-inducible protein DinB